MEERIDTLYSYLAQNMDIEHVLQLDDETFKNELRQFVVKQSLDLTADKHNYITEILFNDLRRFGPITDLYNDPTVTEIAVNKPQLVFVERKGLMELTDTKFRHETHLLGMIRRIVHQTGRRVDMAQPMLDARLPDGSRINIVLPPLSVDGPVITIRRFPDEPLTIDNLLDLKSLSQNMATFLRLAVQSKVNILVSGGTGTGKTTLLNILSHMIPNHERVVTIEDSAELRLKAENLVRLETRLANTEGKGLVTIRDLVRNSLRMRPDRIIVGEVRGEETFDMIKALNTGHEGSMSTVHANSAYASLLRLETLIATYYPGISSQTLQTQISSAIQLIVHINRDTRGRRRVVDIAETCGLNEWGDLIVRSIFSWQNDEFKPTGYAPLISRSIEEKKELAACLEN